MVRDVVSPQLEEFKFVYELEGSLDLSTKYFMASHTEDAIKMFSFVCEKNDLNPVINKKFDPEEYGFLPSILLHSPRSAY
jgi:hypothetical protein